MQGCRGPLHVHANIVGHPERTGRSSRCGQVGAALPGAIDDGHTAWCSRARMRSSSTCAEAQEGPTKGQPAGPAGLPRAVRVPGWVTASQPGPQPARQGQRLRALISGRGAVGSWSGAAGPGRREPIILARPPAADPLPVRAAPLKTAQLNQRPRSRAASPSARISSPLGPSRPSPEAAAAELLCASDPDYAEFDFAVRRRARASVRAPGRSSWHDWRQVVCADGRWPGMGRPGGQERPGRAGGAQAAGSRVPSMAARAASVRRRLLLRA